MEHLKTRVYTGSITLHGYASSMTYPWGVALDDPHTLDDNAYTAVTSKAAEKNGYRYGTMAKVVYPARGTYEDFVYWKYGMWSLLIELASGSTTDIQQTVEAMTVWFDGIDRTPSTQNALNSHCREAGRLDLRNE
ncbi:MAG: hypothetical protein HYR96_13795 [Deltaproteobacteria bacterium]|nr:hypothetical protein [Deltaproteobacteria bacterium]